MGTHRQRQWWILTCFGHGDRGRDIHKTDDFRNDPTLLLEDDIATARQ